jgi:hypothetical protein
LALTSLDTNISQEKIKFSRQKPINPAVKRTISIYFPSNRFRREQNIISARHVKPIIEEEAAYHRPKFKLSNDFPEKKKLQIPKTIKI